MLDTTFEHIIYGKLIFFRTINHNEDLIGPLNEQFEGGFHSNPPLEN